MKFGRYATMEVCPWCEAVKTDEKQDVCHVCGRKESDWHMERTKEELSFVKENLSELVESMTIPDIPVSVEDELTVRKHREITAKEKEGWKEHRGTIIGKSPVSDEGRCPKCKTGQMVNGALEDVPEGLRVKNAQCVRCGYILELNGEGMVMVTNAPVFDEQRG